MGDTTINIGTVNIGGDPERVGEIMKGLASDNPSGTEPVRDEQAPGTSTGSGLAASLQEAEERIADARIAKAEDPDPQSDVYANARRNFLRNLMHHANRARKHEGFQTNHARRPDSITRVSEIQKDEITQADESLQRACASCALSASCSIKGNLRRWLDYHPYAQTTKANKNKRRPGSSQVVRTESRQDFGKRLDDDPLAHCIPPKPQPARKAA